MFKPVTFYSAICDRCGAHFEEECDCIHRHYFSEKEVLSFGTNDNLSGSWEIIGGKVYCPNCYEGELVNGELVLTPKI